MIRKDAVMTGGTMVIYPAKVLHSMGKKKPVEVLLVHGATMVMMSIVTTSDDGGLRDDEVEEFLRSRAKRGRGAIGSRMDEPGPYPSATTLDPDADGQHLVNPGIRFKEEWESRILGPEKPPMLVGSINSLEPLHDEVGGCVHGSKKQHHSRGKKSERTKGKETKKSKNHHHKRRRRRGSDRE